MPSQNDTVTRRSFVAVSLAGVICATMRSARAAPVTPRIVEVDSLKVQIVTDNATFGPFLDNLTLPGLQVLRVGNGGAHAPARMSPHALMGEFGLSVLGESHRAGETRRVIVDFGYTPEVLRNNLGLLGIDSEQIDAAVLSHGHLDHYGGFSGLVTSGSPKRLPLIVGGEETFCERVALIGVPPPVMGTLDRGALSRAGFDVQVRSEPTAVADHAFTTGLIPLQTFERAAIPTAMRPGVGCDRALLSDNKRAAGQIPDDGEHELATCYVVKNLGLVVISSCSHRGVLNTVRRAQAISGINKVHAVIGGFHLVKPRTDDEARRTVAEFAQINPNYLIPMHCTGETFISEALRLMPQKVVRSYVGTQLLFGVASA
jgi:7,8-dihydropterin-6-yl-methyl-4-(beta-D-ribofuranosyl)aminobenzene 5'-phosphate synthase